jgi:hypothetical protein
VWCPRTESNRGPIDYKSIALPAELQGHSLINQVFSLKDQLNQSIINPVSVRCLLAALLSSLSIIFLIFEKHSLIVR